MIVNRAREPGLLPYIEAPRTAIPLAGNGSRRSATRRETCSGFIRKARAEDHQEN